jgi:hypothetical protein
MLATKGPALLYEIALLKIKTQHKDAGALRLNFPAPHHPIWLYKN